MVRRVLVVGGSQADRDRAQRLLGSSGYETDAVGNGAEAFEQLMAMPYDLIVSDACLENLDCPAMLRKVRGLGVKTPILVWTEKTANPSLPDILKLTGGPCVDKAAGDDALAQQVDLVLNGGASPGSSEAAPQNDLAAGGKGGVLLIDERAGEAETLRALLPPSLHFAGCDSANQGMALAHKHKFDLVLFSADTSITNLIGIIAQLHLLLPEGFIVGVATAVRGADPQDAVRALRDLDFDEVVLKPFKPANVERLAGRYCSAWEDLVVVTDDIVRASPRCSRKENYKEFVVTLKGRLEEGLRSLIDACFDRAVVDMSAVESLSPMDFAETLRRLKNVAKPFGVDLKFIAAPALILLLRKFEASFGWDRFEIFPSLESARGEKR